MEEQRAFNLKVKLLCSVRLCGIMGVRKHTFSRGYIQGETLKIHVGVKFDDPIKKRVAFLSNLSHPFEK